VLRMISETELQVLADLKSILYGLHFEKFGIEICVELKYFEDCSTNSGYSVRRDQFLCCGYATENNGGFLGEMVNNELFVAAAVAGDAGRRVESKAKLEANRKRHLESELPHQKLFKLGNPVLEYAIDLNSRAEFNWPHGLISDSTYKLVTSTCN
ncbi:serine carboxypeptidase-like protein 45, partial [Tanacetum coccineum]